MKEYTVNLQEKNMKKTIKTVTAMIMMTAVVQVEAKQPNVSANDIHPSENVKCMEIRSYEVNPNKQQSNHKWTIHMTWCSEPISGIDPIVVKKFRTAKPMSTKEGNIGGQTSDRLINGFIIDKNYKVWKMDEVKDIITQLGEIDTPAEARLILWIDGHTNANHYYKTPKGYEITYMYETTDNECKGCPGTTRCVEKKEVTEKALVNKKGEIVSRKKLKSRSLKRECI